MGSREQERMPCNLPMTLMLGLILFMSGGRVMAESPSPMAQLKTQAATLKIATEDMVSAPKMEDGPASTREQETAEIAAFFAGPEKLEMSATCKIADQEVAIPVLRWETGVMVTKDRDGKEVRQEYRYPILDLSHGVHTLGDGQLCWQVCKKMCDGYGACWLSCAYHCVSQGGEGDPRPK